MDRDDSYRLLLQRMDEVRSLGYQGLLPFVNETVISEPVFRTSGEVWIDVAILWADQKHRSLVIWGTASGSNWWRMDRLDEKIRVSPGESAAG